MEALAGAVGLVLVSLGLGVWGSRLLAQKWSLAGGWGEVVALAALGTGGWSWLLAWGGQLAPFWAVLPHLAAWLWLLFCRPVRFQLAIPLRVLGLLIVGGAFWLVLPSTGWDFCFIWGLKAQVLAWSPPLSWLRWPAHTFAHPDYPLLWPAVLAHGLTLGGELAWVASTWQAAFALGLGAWAWEQLRCRPKGLSLLAVASVLFAPFLALPRFRGYADPLLALAFAFLAQGVVSARRRFSPGRFGLGLVLAPLLKAEGLVFALLAGFWVFREGKLPGRWVALGLVPGLAWQGAVSLWSIPREPLNWSPHWWGPRVGQLATAFTHLPWTHVIMAGLLLATLALANHKGLWYLLGGYLLVVAGFYLLGPHPLAWWTTHSLDRVLAVPFPATLVLALGEGKHGDRAAESV